jgi:5-oxoprolinase (ATP-hydrolysing) subunit A
VNPQVRTVDFNADLGESFGLWTRGADDELMQTISSANVACGFHAGDPATMRAAVASAKRHGVAVGAHPGLPDQLGFGRRVMDVSESDARDYVLYQAGALAGFVRAAGLTLHHVKPHGALYMMALEDRGIARAIAEAVAQLDEGLPIYTLAASEMWNAARAAGLEAVAEFFADRPIHRDGSVLMFGWQEHFAATPAAVADRVRSLVTTGSVQSLEGDPVAVTASTICVHSDTPGAGEIGRAVRAAIEGEGVSVSGGLGFGTARPAETIKSTRAPSAGARDGGCDERRNG